MHLVPKTALGETIPVASTRPIALESYCTRKSVLRNKSSRPALPPNRALDVLFPIIIDSFTYSPIDFLNTRLVCSFDSTFALIAFCLLPLLLLLVLFSSFDTRSNNFRKRRQLLLHRLCYPPRPSLPTSLPSGLLLRADSPVFPSEKVSHTLV